MAAEENPRPSLSLVVSSDVPLVGIVFSEVGREATCYFARESEADAAAADQATTDARALVGAWSDRDWAVAIEELDRIRHESTPTPPIGEW